MTFEEVSELYLYSFGDPDQSFDFFLDDNIYKQWYWYKVDVIAEFVARRDAQARYLHLPGSTAQGTAQPQPLRLWRSRCAGVAGARFADLELYFRGIDIRVFREIWLVPPYGCPKPFGIRWNRIVDVVGR